MSLVDFLRRRKKFVDTVVFDDVGVTRTRTDGVTESIRWEDVAEVGIVTTDEGPFAEDVFILLLSADKKQGCCIPQGASGSQELLGRLQKLPGFDNKALIGAMGSTANANFTCWKKG